MSTARSKDKQAQIEVIKDLIIEDFTSLTDIVSKHKYFSSYKLKRASQSISLEQAGITLQMVGQEIWSDKDRFQEYFQQNKEPNRCVCLVFESEYFDMDSLDLDDNLHSIYLPMTGLQLAVNISNLFRQQSNILKSHQSKEETEEASEHVKYVLQVSRELNGIRDTDRLLSLILQKAREVTSADAGSIYVIERDDHDASGDIIFKITQNETVTQDLKEFKIPVSEGSIVGNAVIQRKSINIPDLYQLDADPTKNEFGVSHDRTWDERTGYQCRSMLTLPMFDISHQVIGVIQLINRRKPGIQNLKSVSNFSDFILPFEADTVEYAEIVAQQAGIALENALLTEEKEQLFEGFVHASVTAIEQRDPTTSGHSHRVAQLTLELARIIHDCSSGSFKKVIFNQNEFKEIEYASLLHDFGKLGVREQVLVKAKKLYPWELEIIQSRFDFVESRYYIKYLEDHISFLENKKSFPPGFSQQNLQRTYEKKRKELNDYLKFIMDANEPTVLEQGSFERLKEIANLTYQNLSMEKKPILSNRELEALSVSRGSLTRDEFAEIQSHVSHTYEFLRKIPWGRDFKNIPQIAAKHHEKLDGSGYPNSAKCLEIPIQTRIMTISDIYDALTASDRPYKKAVPINRALEILEFEVKAGKVDKEIFDLFVESKAYDVLGGSNHKAS